MPVYSKTGKKWGHDFAQADQLTLDKANINDPTVVYYHHPYDSLMEGVPLYNCLNDINWLHIKNNPSVILLHDNDSETFDINFVKDVSKTINLRKINPNQLQIVVMDENHRDFLERMLISEGIRGVDIRVKNYLLKEIKFPKQDLTPIKKFSSLSRNYRDWRLRLYVELLKRNILDNNFIYSFFNIWPYSNPPKVYSKDVMVEDLQKIGFKDIDKNIKEWLKSCPHELDSSNNVLNKWSNITYDAIQSSNIHIIIETHYDQSFFSQKTGYDRNFSPSSITEKAYKPIACKRPFIAFSTPFWLEDLRRLGFKTFSPYINEEYDKVTDNTLRLNMIVDEIERISKLTNDEFNNLVSKCQEIAIYNYNKLVEKQNA